jgi:nicotinate-nucleotide pyrophosphorylase (carboxylating)
VSTWLQPEPVNWLDDVDNAISEDVGFGDVTGGCIPSDLLARWRIEAQADGILSGVGIAEYLLSPLQGDPEECWVEVRNVDGDRINRGDTVIEGLLPAQRSLLAERTALNFVMHLSGVATLTSQFVAKVQGTNARIVDTRKTLPGLRMLQKYAVRCGGGQNHRMGLYDGAMVKDNHIIAMGSIRDAVNAIRKYASHMTKIEVEATTLEMVAEAVGAGADIVLLDNMDPFMMREAVRAHEGQCLFEASGGINLETVRGVAQTGVDIISVGALTHSASAIPFHMEFE